MGQSPYDTDTLMYPAKDWRTTYQLNERKRFPEAQIVSGRGEFVGREHEMAVLKATVGNAIEGQGGIVLLSGEAGIGKTRTAEEVVTFARRCGAWVCSARGWEGDGAPPFWPWAQVIRTYVREHEPLQVATQMGQSSADIIRFLPELRQLLPEMEIVPTSAELESDEVRFRVFEGVVSFLKNAADQQPVVLVFDDLHWTDQASLVLLEYLVGEIQTSRLLVIGTYRDWEVHSRNDLSRTIAEIARHGWTRHVSLRGLTEGEVAKFVSFVCEGGCPDLASAVHEKTEGNPLFVTELVRLLLAEQAKELSEGGPVALTVPQTVRGVIRRRLEALSNETKRILEVASVMGRDFELAVIEAVLKLSTGYAVDIIDEAVSMRLVIELPDKIGNYRFVHILIRDTIYEDLARGYSRDLHNAIGAAMEERYGGHLDSYASVLAYHFYQGVLGGSEKKTIDYSLLAAGVAVGSLAYEEATIHYRRALEVLGHRLQDRATRCRVLLSLGEALQRGGDWGGARATFKEAKVLAAAIGAADAFAVAAVGFKGVLSAIDPVDEEAIALLRDALDMVGSGETRLRIRLLSELATSLYFEHSGDEAETCSEKAVALARNSGDAVSLGIALESKIYSLWRPGRSLEVLDTATELLSLAARDAELSFRAHLFRYEALVQLGRHLAAEREWTYCRSISEELRQPRCRWQAELAAAARALSHGCIDDAAALSSRARPLGEVIHKPTAAHYDVIQRFLISRLRGDVSLVRRIVVDGSKLYPQVLLYRIGVLAVTYMVGETREARDQLDELELFSTEGIRKDTFMLLGLSTLAEVCAGLGEGERAVMIYRLLVPYAAQNVVCGRAAACDGSVSHYLGLLATTLERWDDAVRHFEDALEMNGRMNFVPFVARTQHFYAASLLQRGRSADRDRAVGLLSDAVTTYRRLGMDGYLRDAMKIAATVPELSCLVAAKAEGERAREGIAVSNEPGESSPPREPPRENPALPAPAEMTGENLFRREGEYWTIRYRGRVLHLKNMRGMEYIALLLGQPGKEIHSLDLSALACRASSAANLRESPARLSKEDRLHVTRLGDAGPLLDAKSRARYRSRLGALGREVEEAERLNDVLKAAAARREMEMLARELSAGARRGGGPRLAGSYAERARINVRNNIAAALRAIRRHDEELWRHLYRGVRTGTYCAYIPEAGVDWQL